MLNIAVVEDSPDDLDHLKAHLTRYEQERGGPLRIDCFSNAEDLLASYRPDYDLVLMDIELPGANGMMAARALRILDPHVSLVFTTNLASFAVDGYEVNALSYLLKPVGYPAFSLAVDKASCEAARKQSRPYAIRTADGVAQVSVSSIRYVEVVRHTLFYHTVQGTLRCRGSMQQVEQDLGPLGFSRCHNAYLVNLNHVAQAQGNDVTVGRDVLPISRQRKQRFMRELTESLGV